MRIANPQPDEVGIRTVKEPCDYGDGQDYLANEESHLFCIHGEARSIVH